MNNIKKDILGNVLQIGDSVVFADNDYRSGYFLRQGTIIGFTKKYVKLSGDDKSCYSNEIVIRFKIEEKIAKIKE